MKATRIFEGYGHPEQLPLFLDRMGELVRKHWDWREEIRALPMPALLIFADHDSVRMQSVRMQHIAEVYALFGGGIRESGVESALKHISRVVRCALDHYPAPS